MKESGNKEDPLILYSDNEEEYDTTNKHSANLKSITGATIFGSRSPTYMPALDDTTVEGYSLKNPNENTIINDSSAVVASSVKLKDDGDYGPTMPPGAVCIVRGAIISHEITKSSRN